MGISFSCWRFVTQVTDKCLARKSPDFTVPAIAFVLHTIIICHLVRSPWEPDSPLPHTSCNHLHQCKVSAKHSHTSAERSNSSGIPADRARRVNLEIVRGCICTPLLFAQDKQYWFTFNLMPLAKQEDRQTPDCLRAVP